MMVVGQPNTLLPMPDLAHVNSVDIKVKGAEQGVVASEGHVATSENSLYCNPGSDDQESGIVETGPLTQRADRGANDRDTGGGLPNAQRNFWDDQISGLNFGEPLIPLQDRDPFPYDMTMGVADLREHDLLLGLDQGSEASSPSRGRPLERRTSTRPREVISRPRNRMAHAHSSDRIDNRIVGGHEEIENEEVICKVPFRQREPSAETANISLPPVASPESGSDSSEGVLESLLTLSPVPLPAYKKSEGQNKGDSPRSGPSADVASAGDNPALEVENDTGRRSLGNPETPNRRENCRGVLTPSTRASQNAGLKPSQPNTPKKQMSSPSKSSVLGSSPRSLEDCSTATSPKQGASSPDASLIGEPNTPGKITTSPSKSPSSPEGSEPLEGVLIQQYGNSPTPSQGQRTAMVRAWIRGGDATALPWDIFSTDIIPSPTLTQISSPAADDAELLILDGSWDGNEGQDVQSGNQDEGQLESPDEGQDEGQDECPDEGQYEGQDEVHDEVHDEFQDEVQDEVQDEGLDESQNELSDPDMGSLISLAGSPSASSRLDMPWSSTAPPEEITTNVLTQSARKVPTIPDVCLPDVMPYTETFGGSVAVLFPKNVARAVFKIHVVATCELNRVGDEGWREFIWPGFVAQDEEMGSLAFKFAENGESYEFDTEALSWAEIDSDALYTEFELAKGVNLPVHQLRTHTQELMDGFIIENSIRSTYSRLEGDGGGFAVEYTATCGFKVLRQNFRSERCCFYVILEGGPCGHFEFTFGGRQWHARLKPEMRASAGNTEIVITCPFIDIGKTFCISWGVDLDELPAKTWVPKLRPLLVEEQYPKPTWMLSYGMPDTRSQATPAVEDNFDDAVESLDDAGESSDGIEEVLVSPNQVADNNLDDQGASEGDEVSNSQDSVVVGCGETALEHVRKIGRQVRLGRTGSEAYSEFMDHPGSPWIERDFGMVSFLIPLLFVIGELLRKIICNKICSVGHFLKSSICQVSIRTWIKICLLSYLGSLFVGVSPIQRFDGIVHRLAVVERRATMDMVSPLLGWEYETVVAEPQELFLVRSSLEDICKGVAAPEVGAVHGNGADSKLVPGVTDKHNEDTEGSASGKAETGTEGESQDEGRKREIDSSKDGKPESKFKPGTVPNGADTVLVFSTKSLDPSPDQQPRVTVLSVRDRVDRFLGWRGHEVE
ncbi:hypothetical protein FQN54_001088 [Arachnomyces sp. PD_36]|nr:hypothetical protein FQN54_001088 [Arachnomyces sp. PD_36]